MDRLIVMLATRGRGWGIDLFLWVCPLAGVGIFVAIVLAGNAPLPKDARFDTRYFDVPNGGLQAMLGGAVLVPLIAALLTRRLLGFLAGAALFLLIAAATAWAGSHWTSESALLFRVTRPPQHAAVRGTIFESEDGGFALAWFGGGDPEWVEGIRTRYLAAGREQSLSFRGISPGQGYPSRENYFETTPQPLRRFGFAMAVHPRAYERIWSLDLPFAIALPYWFLCLLAAPFPLAWTIRFRRRRRAARRARVGLCMNCGYDLRATPNSNGTLLPICPECGAADKPERPQISTSTQIKQSLP